VSAPLPSRARLAAAVLLVPLALAACGKKGDLKPPPGHEAEYTWPHTYPDAATVRPQGETADKPQESTTSPAE
jgi:predicted small lipoprotein YifL